MPLTAGEYGGGNLLQFRRGEDKKQMFGRFLQNLQQSIESTGGEHVHFVYDIDTFFHHCRRKNSLLPQGTDIVHAVIGGRVQLHNVHHAALGNGPTGRAFTAGVAVDGMLAVDCFGKDAGTGGFARAANACEQVGMGQMPGDNLVAQRISNMLLTDHIIKGLRTPFAIERLIHASAPPGKITKALDKTAHPGSNDAVCPPIRQLAQSR